ncbi:hypothetical protein [Mycobacterium genavense]|uniref:hypothetical protein n=1 Tax=Mycobacterium genavense TaxID=36812 RepID=UPI0004BC4212|nr:hypothetical protein [Mycobacterium genavense]
MAAELIEELGPTSSDAESMRELPTTARLHAPLFTLRGGTNEVMRGMIARQMGIR